MTTILIDFKTRKIVADRQRTGSGVNRWTNSDTPEKRTYEFINKIKVVEEGVYLVGSGCSYEVNRQFDNLVTFGCIDPVVKGDCSLVVVRRKGEGLFVDCYDYTKTKLTWFTKTGKFKHSVVQGEENFITFGSGGKYAHGAFKAGVSAEEAVKAAGLCDEYSSYEIDVVEL